MKNSKMGWLWGVMIILCLLVPAGCTATPGSKSATPTPIPASAAPANPTYTVTRGEVVKELKFRALIVPVVKQDLFFRSGGFVRKVYVSRFDMVKSGQVLADLEIGDLENQLAQAKVNQKTAETQLSAAQQAINDALADAQIELAIEKLRLEEAQYYLQLGGGTHERIAEQIEEQAVLLAENKVTRLQRGPDPQLAQAVDVAKLVVERLTAQIADSSIVAPYDGEVLAINISEGDNVAAFNRGVITICDPSKLEASANLPSDQLSGLSEGLAVNVTLTGQSQPLQGVVRILPAPYGSGSAITPNTNSDPTQPNDSSARITINAAPTDAGYRMGDMVNVQVILERKANALWLPPVAIRDFEGRKFVVVQDGENQRRVNVTIGIQTDTRVEITDGLQEGQIVVGQ